MSCNKILSLSVSAGSQSSDKISDMVSSNSSHGSEPSCFESTETDERATITNIDDYVGLLYEGNVEKIKSSALLLQLARNPDNLLELANNGKSFCLFEV